VNSVGVNINTASVPLLASVSGIGQKLAENIVKFRTEYGKFKTRKTIQKVPRLGAKAYEQAAGFLRIKNGDNPLDNSGVHPESYPIVKRMAQKLKVSEQDLIANKTLINQLNLNDFTTNKAGLFTLTQIKK
jgi:uncharacterized protein